MRHVILWALVVFLAATAHAEEEYSPYGYALTHHHQLKVALPLYGGVAVGQSLAGDNSRVGGLYGFGLDFWFGRRDWSLELGLLSVSKGFEQGGITARLDYLQLPIIVRRTLWQNLALGVGGYVAPALIAASLKSGTVSTDSSDFSGDYGLVFSVRYTQRIQSKTRFGFEARYNIGLSNVSKTSTHQLRTLLLMATLEFGLW